MDSVPEHTPFHNNGHTRGPIFSDEEVARAKNAYNALTLPPQARLRSLRDRQEAILTELALCELSLRAYARDPDAYVASGLDIDATRQKEKIYLQEQRAVNEEIAHLERDLSGAEERGAGYTNGAGKQQGAEEAVLVEVMQRAKTERETPHEPLAFPCPDKLWRGPFAWVADTMGKTTWEVWLGTAVALSARAHKNIHFHYHRPLFAMIYGLLIKPTGLGKGLATDVCHDLMPDWYTVDAVQSGPALAPILAEIERDEKGKFLSAKARPALLLLEEFTSLLKNAHIQNSTIVDTLNNLFHRNWAWNMSRSERGAGGGDVVIPAPTLSILATTTESLLKEYVPERMIRSGFLNRFLVLPGDSTPWKFYDPDNAGASTSALRGLLDDLPKNQTAGNGVSVWNFYTPDALARLKTWGEKTFEPIMNSGSIEAETQKRLHMYSGVEYTSSRKPG